MIRLLKEEPLEELDGLKTEWLDSGVTDRRGLNQSAHVRRLTRVWSQANPCQALLRLVSINPKLIPVYVGLTRRVV